MENFNICSNAEIIRHKGEETFYFPIMVKGHSELCLYPVFPETVEDEVFVKFYDDPAEWEAFTLPEAQEIHRLRNPIVPTYMEDCFV